MPASLRSIAVAGSGWTYALPAFATFQLRDPFAPVNTPMICFISPASTTTSMRRFCNSTFSSSALSLALSEALSFSVMSGDGGGFELFRLCGDEIGVFCLLVKLKLLFSSFVGFL